MSGRTHSRLSVASRPRATRRGPLFAAVDCGTSEVKAEIVDGRGEVVGRGVRRVPCVYHPDGRVRQDAGMIRDGAMAALRRAAHGAAGVASRVVSLCVANQRATVLCLDRHGAPLGHAVSWQDMRGAPDVASLRRRIADDAYYRITGLPNHAVFSLAKLLCLRRCEGSLFRRAARFALIQDFLLRELGGEDYVTDHANASLTGMLDVRTRRWSDTILDAARLSADRLPALVPPGQVVGRISRGSARRCGLLEGTPLVSGAGDQQCAGVGAGVVSPGICSITLGTAGVCFCHAERPVFDPRRRISCCAHAVPGKWNLEGLQNTAGDSVRWAGRRLAGGRGRSDALLRRAAEIAPGANGVFFLPYLAGAAAPHWISEASAMFAGLRHAADEACMMRAVLEGVAFENRQILEVFRAMQVPVREIRLTGGFSQERLWSRIQADIYGRPVLTLANPQATLLGAAMLGALGVGAVDSLQDAARAMVRVREHFTPSPGAAAQYDGYYAAYVRLIKSLIAADVFGHVLRRE